MSQDACSFFRGEVPVYREDNYKHFNQILIIVNPGTYMKSALRVCKCLETRGPCFLAQFQLGTIVNPGRSCTIWDVWSSSLLGMLPIFLWFSYWGRFEQWGTSNFAPTFFGGLPGGLLSVSFSSLRFFRAPITVLSILSFPAFDEFYNVLNFVRISDLLIILTQCVLPAIHRIAKLWRRCSGTKNWEELLLFSSHHH